MSTALELAVSHLDRRSRRVCDYRGNIAWNLQDVTAVKLVLAELKPRCIVCGAPASDQYCPAHSDLLGDAS